MTLGPGELGNGVRYNGIIDCARQVRFAKAVLVVLVIHYHVLPVGS